MNKQIQSGTPPPSAADLATCDSEPIHIPGLIQPHGILFALTNPDFRITAISANAASLLGHDPGTLLNTAFEHLLPPESFEALKQAAEQPNENPIHLVEFPLGSAAAAPGRAIIHATPTGILLEALLSRPDWRSYAFSKLFSQFEHGTRHLQAAKDVSAVCGRLAAEVRRLTGYDRVKIYRFAADNTGEVVAEDNSGRLPSYLGLHFPASDIPTQARTLYLRNPEREIPDINYTPVPLIQAGPAPIDLSPVTLRSVSPVHLEYLRNMSVGASMSVSIVRGGMLWGLVACHHHTTHFVPPELRQACVLLAQFAASQLGFVEGAESGRRAAGVKEIETLLFRDGNIGRDYREILVESGNLVLDLVQANGFALLGQGATTTIGTVPGGSDMLNLQRFMARRGPEVFATDNLASEYPDGAALPDAAGMLAIPLGGTPQDIIVWFRPEIIQTVKWAGDPGRTVEVREGLERLTPRRSFELFTQEVRGRARPWQPYEIAAAQGLRDTIVDIILRRTQQLEFLVKQRTPPCQQQ